MDKKVELTDEQTDMVERLKAAEREFTGLIDDIDTRATGGNQRRWVALARTHIETGFMFAVKALTNGRGV